MRRVLSFTDYYWPGYKAGGTIRAFMNQVDYLKDEYAFHIVTSDTDYTETTPYPGITPGQWTETVPGVHVYYVSAAARKPALFWRLLRERPYDVVYIHLLFGFWFSFLPLLLAIIARHRCIIVAPHGVLGKGALGVKSGRKLLFLRVMRLLGLYRRTSFHSVTDHETTDIRTHIGNRISIREARELPRRITRPPERNRKTAGSLKIVTIARVSPEKNQLFALEILKGIAGFSIQYDLIGPVYDEAYWDKCQSLMAQMPGNVSVRYRGSIHSEQIPEELRQYDLMLLPTTGENFGHTILESFMAGCPVIISDQTPWKNLEAEGIGQEIPLDRTGDFRKALEFFAGMNHDDFVAYSDKAYNFASGWCGNPEMLDENRRLFNC